MSFFRGISALSKLRSRSGQQLSLNSISSRWIQMQSSGLDLHSELKEMIPEQQERLKKLKKEHGNTQLGNITADMVLGGMRGMIGMLWETSLLDPEEGIRFRGLSIPECQKVLPTAKPGGEPLPEGLLWLLLTGKIPSKEQVDALSKELRERASIPDYVYKTIDALPVDAHPMTQFSTGVMALQVQSEFQKAYEKGIHKSKFWEPTYEDCLNLIARVPAVAAHVYRRIYKNGQVIQGDDSLDYGGNFAHMLGFSDPQMLELMRLYITIHSDHEGGNVSAHTGHLVASALSDPFLSFAAALNGLAGPLHGLANQEVLLWIKSVVDECGENISTDQLKEYVWKTLNSGKVKIIVSSHNYEKTPSLEEIGTLVARRQATGADIVKVATTAQDITDCARVFQVLAHSQIPIIGLVMGDKGFMSRILSAKFGGFLTFGSLEAGVVSAPGQPTVKDLLDLYNFRQIGPDTKVHGVIGNPIGHSKSPHLYNPSFKSVGFNGIYLPLLVDNVANFLNTYSSPDFVGYSYTIPHKVDGLRCCDEVDPIAKAIGAISCMIKRPTDGKLIGYNVDYLGAIAAIEEGLRGSNGSASAAGSPLAGKLFVVVGAGGAGKALAYGGRAKGARVVVANRTFEKAVDLAHKVDGKAITLAELNDFHPEEGMILANTTSVGMKPNVDVMPIAKEALKHYSLVFDAIYTPKLTKLLRAAQESGAITVYGTEMFINQAFVQFENFTGLPAPKTFIRELLAKNT